MITTQNNLQIDSFPKHYFSLERQMRICFEFHYCPPTRIN
ncbi:hypothetical protein VIBNISFn118_730037 [Vibrio nigripulchritudo SFn118]|nr:hypothetical protein VIBNISFn118_730037 [Vibrio nigripulchritudo SFn118]